ncbi:MAG: CFI-box-CTERM domain-containing protein, partial [Candidatus Hadarchaeum sp.]|uniref:CFI-box-CTERM domain-containing protein n=1 Tax=Candidatus Hadarchaeum sp. TaxID=2883567 RepID=UPI003D0B03A2
RYVCKKDNVEFLLSLERRGGGCFIATAAFETPWAYEINVLRQFRDNFLLQRKWGRKFISAYYRESPPIARAIERSAGLRMVFRALLAPIIKLGSRKRDQL